MIEIFKTNVETEGEAAFLKSFLSELFPAARITFDLDDCDRILRIEAGEEPADLLRTTEILFNNGFFCEVLEDAIPLQILRPKLEKRISFTFKNSMGTLE
ncbi:MAG TPA: hypothetical protein VEC36_07330 [Patescibacteria group bacterium]|nr:hypothetical protein [Patescibacteria group bacterium]